MTAAGVPGTTCASSCSRFMRACTLNSVTTSRAMAPTSHAICSSTTRPASIFEKSRMSSMRRSSVLPERPMISRYSRCSSVSVVLDRRLVIPSTPFIGVRNSWLMIARKSLLLRAACSACSRANRSVSSARRRSVTSVQVPTTRAGRPCASRVMIRPRASNQRQSPSRAWMRYSETYRSRPPARCASRSRSTAGRSSGCTSACQRSMWMAPVGASWPTSSNNRRDPYSVPLATSQSHTPSSVLSSATFHRSSASRTAASVRRRSVRSTSTPVM